MRNETNPQILDNYSEISNSRKESELINAINREIAASRGHQHPEYYNNALDIRTLAYYLARAEGGTWEERVDEACRHIFVNAKEGTELQQRLDQAKAIILKAVENINWQK